MSPADVATASPMPIGATRSLSSWIAGPPARAIAPATPPPCASRVLAALAIASTSSLVMSASRTSTLAIAASIALGATSPRSTLWNVADEHARHSGRGGVPPDHLLADGGGAADHRREHRPRDAALAPDGARDARAPRAGRLRHPRGGQLAALHRPGRGGGRGDRRPPPADRAVPDRRRRHRLGRRARGGREAGARDVTRVRAVDDQRGRGREDLSARAPDRARQADSRRAAGRRGGRARRSRSCGSRTRRRTCSTTSRTWAWRRA